MDLLCDVLDDLERTKNSDVYFRILLLVCMSALVLIGWVAMFVAEHSQQKA